MSIVTKERIIMPVKHYLFVLSVFAVIAGCNLLDRQPAPNIVTVPPYLHSQSQSELEEIRVFHDKESAKILEDIHIVRNHEIERLEAAGKEIERDKLWQEDYKKTVEQREKWTSWFKKKNNNETPMVSSRTDETNKNVR